MFKLLKVIENTLFGGSDSASEGVKFAQSAAKGIGSFIDEQKFTGQEKAEMNLETGKMMIGLIQSTQNENSVRSITRRYLAWGVTMFVLFWASIGMVFSIYGKQEIVNNMIAVAEAYNIGWGFSGVLAFYFAANLVRANKS